MEYPNHWLSSSRLSPQGGSGRLQTSLQSFLSSTLSRSTTLPSSWTQSIHRFLGRPLFLVPGSLRSAAHLTNSFSSILFTCPYHLSLLSCIFSLSSVTFNSCFISSFLILSRLVTPLMARRHLISATSNFFTCSSFTAQVSAPYRITGLTIVLYTCVFSLIGIRLSYIIPLTFLHVFPVPCSLACTSLSKSPLSCSQLPRYLKAVICFSCCPSAVINH